MKDREKLLELYDIYKKLLTEKQREYFETYYFQDLSLSEISENMKVSRTIINKTIKIVENKLYEYESLLKISEKNKIIEELRSL